jgi:hypothetical protein
MRISKITPDKIERKCFNEVLSKIIDKELMVQAYVGINLSKGKTDKTSLLLATPDDIFNPKRLHFYNIELEESDIQSIGDILRVNIYNNGLSADAAKMLSKDWKEHFQKNYQEISVVKDNALFSMIIKRFLKDYPFKGMPSATMILLSYDKSIGKRSSKPKICPLERVSIEKLENGDYLFYIFKNLEIFSISTFTLDYYLNRYNPDSPSFKKAFGIFLRKKRKCEDRIIKLFKYFNLAKEEIEAYELKKALN